MFRGIGNTKWDDVIDYHCYYDCCRKNFIVQEGVRHWGNTEDNQLVPSTKEQHDTLFAKIEEAGYEWDAEKKELKKVEDEEYNGEDYGIDSLFHAQRILEKTLGRVEGYQTDDGILSHKCAITAVKKLYEQRPAEWSKEDEEMCQETIDWFEKKCFPYALESENPARESIKWLKSLKDRVGCEANCITTKEWSVEDMSKMQRICKYLDEAKKYYADITEVRECIDWLKSLKDRYTRTDAFIEQVEKYLQEHLIDYWSQSVTDENKFIEDFKNYIKGK
jgi:hypothetical protein